MGTQQRNSDKMGQRGWYQYVTMLKETKRVRQTKIVRRV